MAHRYALTLSAVMLIVVAASSARDQSGDNWYFGYSGGVTFVNGAPEPLAGGQINQNEGCATISDTSGNLLFYTDGISVWNANHDVMPNGTGLKGNPSATQSGIIVPKPGNSDTFYIFTVPATNSSDGLNYSVVDITLDSGNGDVVSGQKNINLMATCSEEVTATAHSNGTDIWVLARPYNSNEFHAFQVSSSGVNATAVVSAVGTATDINGSIGYLKASPNGDKLAMAYYFLNTGELYDFDAATGQVSNAVNLGTLTDAYGLEFSQDGTRLYIARFMINVVQFDLTAGDIPGSVVQVSTDSNASAMQLGPDGKIYISRGGASKLGVINSPNSLGAACDYQASGPDIAGTCQYGLPSFIQSFFAASADFTTEENVALNFAQADFATPYNDVTSETLMQVQLTSVPTNGTLTVGSTPVANNDELDVADLDNLTYTPDDYFNGNDTFEWQGNSGGSYNFNGTFTVEVTAVAQEPSVTLPTGANIGEQTTNGLVITPNSNDGSEITHFKITEITGGVLYLNDGTTELSNGSFITAAEAAAGLKFTPTSQSCGFTVAGATSADDADVSANIHVVSFTALPVLPVVTTASVSDVDTNTAVCGGTVTDDGGGAISARGVCWSTSADPTTSDNKTTDGVGTGAFESEISDLDSETKYYVRAYATNGAGTSYGETKTFTTAADDFLPDLRVMVTAMNESAYVGDELSFMVDVENVGDATATEVELHFPLPVSAIFVGAWLVESETAQAQPLDAEVDGDEIVLTLGEVEVAEGMTIEVVLESGVAGAVMLKATVSSAEHLKTATAQADAAVDDEYWQVVETRSPVPICGTLGFMSCFLITFGLIAMKRQTRRTF